MRTSYNAQDQEVSITDATGFTVTTTYDGFGRLATVSRPGVGIRSSTYDEVGNIVLQIDEEGRSTTYKYDSLNRLTQLIDAAGGSTSYAYDNNGHLIATTDPNGNTVYQQYDSLGRVSERGRDLVNDFQVESFNYSSSGLLITSTDVFGLTTIYNYEHGRLINTVDPVEGITEYGYDNLGRLTQLRERPYLSGESTVFGKVSLYEYDFLGRLHTSSVPGTGTTTNIYDIADRLLSSDVEGKTTTYTYDAAGRKITMSDPMDRTTTYAYDAANRLTSTTDALLHTESTVYYPSGRVWKQRDALLGDTIFTYTNSGNVASVTDPVGNVTTFEYDGVNRLKTEITTNGTRQFAYDAAGNLISATDRTGRVRTFTYRFDFNGTGKYQRTHELWWTGSTITNDLESIYDPKGRVVSEGDKDSRYVYDYNTLNQLEFVRSEVDSKLPQATAVGLDYSYDVYGRHYSSVFYQQGILAVGRNATDPQFVNDVTSYNFDDTVSSILQFAFDAPYDHVTDKLVNLTYDTSGRLTQIERMYVASQADGPYLRTNYAYNDDDEVIGMTHNHVNVTYTPFRTETSSQFQSYGWVHDAVGRIQSTSGPDGTTTYTYDSTDQLSTAVHSYQGNEAYAYDANGNRSGGLYTTGSFNRLTSDGTFTYTYDLEGNRATRTAIAGGAFVSYAWDYRQRLTEVQFKTSSSGALTKKIVYTYDVNDRLLIKQLDSNGDGTFDETERYVYDDDNVAMIMDGTDNVSHYYLNGPGTDQLFADEDSLNNVLWTLSDNQGTVRDWVDFHSGSTVTTSVDHLKYDSYGKITAQSNSNHEVRYSYTGREWDSDVGLYYYRARWYDPTNGRFISEDPIGFDGGDTNLHRYVGNGPINGSDPTGLWTFALSAGGRVHALSQPKDTLLDLSNQGYSLSTLLPLAPSGVSKDTILTPGTVIDISSFLPPLMLQDLEHQQNLELSEILPSIKDHPFAKPLVDYDKLINLPLGITIGESGVPLHKTTVPEAQFGVGNCYGFALVFYGYKPPLGLPGRSVTGFGLAGEPFQGATSNSKPQNGVDNAFTPPRVWVTPPGGLLPLLKSDKQKTDVPQFGSLALFTVADSDLFFHAAIVLGRSRPPNSQVYILQKFNSYQAIGITTVDEYVFFQGRNGNTESPKPSVDYFKPTK